MGERRRSFPMRVIPAFVWTCGIASAFQLPPLSRGSQCLCSAPFQRAALDARPAVRLVQTARTAKRKDQEEGEAEDKPGRKPFPFGRFVKTLVFFNGPSAPGVRRVRTALGKSRDRKRTRSAAAAGVPATLTDGVVLVTGATGGVGKRVVDLLRSRGLRVRAMVRNRSKGLAMLSGGKEPRKGSDLEIVVGDVCQPHTLRPALFQDVTAVVSCTAAIVQPKEGDGEDRAKYFQGIKFYEPEVADTPEDTEFKGLRNLLTALLRYSDIRGKVLFSSQPGFQDGWTTMWGALDDVVMGGISESEIRIVPGAGEDVGGDAEAAGGGRGARAAAVFSGQVSTSNSGGFVSVRTKNFSPALDLAAYDGLRLRVKGDGNRYKFILYDAGGWDRMSWCHSFDTVDGQWQDVDIAFQDLAPVFRTKTMRGVDPLKKDQVFSFQLMLSKFEYDGDLNPSFQPGRFSVAVSSIKAVTLDESPGKVPPRLVHISSAGVTRPGKPGLVVDDEPPAVRMNDMLGGLLTFKLKGEDLLRGSGLPVTIVRPCALTEEPRGAPIVVSQGDTIKGKISRDDVAELVVEGLMLPEAAGMTLEVKSDLAFSDVWDGKAPQQRDYRSLFASLDRAVNGKEWMKDKDPASRAA